MTTPVSLPPLTYLSFDSVSEGVGASQVIPYVVKLARSGMKVALHSFEKHPPLSRTVAELEDAGVRWVAHDFGPPGPLGGLARVARGARAIGGAELLHARSDLAAAAALLTRAPRWLWDMRGFWADERIDQGTLTAGSLEERTMRLVERRAARAAGAIVTLADAALPVLVERHGPTVASKTRTITTNVDLDRFALTPLSPVEPVKVLASGTLNNRYDVETMARFVDQLARLTPTALAVLCPREARPPNLARLKSAIAGVSVDTATPWDMPAHIGESHVGIAILKQGRTPANRASMPTKLGEFLACGRPVVVGGGVGDMAKLLAEFDAGVALTSTSDSSLARAASNIVRLLNDSSTAMRCRALAESHFDLDRGVASLLEVYSSIVNKDSQ